LPEFLDLDGSANTMRETIQFAEFMLDPRAFELRRDGEVVRLERKPLEALILLAERPGELVSREEILEKIWGKDVYVDADNSINAAIRKIRAALKDDPENPRFLYTVPGKGYRFTGEFKSKGLVSTASLTPGAQSTNSRRKWMAVVGLSFGLAALLAFAWLQHKKSSQDPQRLMLAVLPFVNLSGDPKQEYFADGFTEELITQLGGLQPERLGVIARTSSMQYKNAKKGAASIAQELKVQYLLEGSVRRSGDRILVAAQLIQANDQTHLWAGDFQATEQDVLKLQNDVALAISKKIALTLSPVVRARLGGALHVNAEAHQAYLEARQDFEARTKEGTERGIAEYQRAIAIDPGYAPPYAGLAAIYSLAPVTGVMPAGEAFPKAKEAALKAVQLDESLSSGHTALGFVLAHYDFDWQSAEREYRRGIELNPNDAQAHFFFSNSYLSPMGKHEEAIKEMKAAVDLDPRSAAVLSFSGQTFVWAKRYAEALTQYKKCDELFPGFAINHERMAHLYAYMGQFDKAIAEDTRARILAGEKPDVAMKKDEEFQAAFAKGGPNGYWEKLLDSVSQTDGTPESYRSAQDLAILYTKLGDKETALTLLEGALETKTLKLTELAVEPAFEPLRSEPRFQKLLKRLGLPNLRS